MSTPVGEQCLVTGMGSGSGSRSQGQVTSSSEIGLGNGQPAGNSLGQASLGPGPGQQPAKDATPGELLVNSLQFYTISSLYSSFSNISSMFPSNCSILFY